MLYFKCLHIISFYFGHIITVDDVNKCFLFSWIAGDKIAHNLCFGNKLTVGVNGPSPLFPVSNTGTLHKDKHHNSLLCKYITHYEESNIKDCLFPPLLSLSLTPPLSDQCSTAVARACFFLTSGGQNCNQFYRGNSPHTQTAIADLFLCFHTKSSPTFPVVWEQRAIQCCQRSPVCDGSCHMTRVWLFLKTDCFTHLFIYFLHEIENMILVSAKIHFMQSDWKLDIVLGLQSCWY